MTELALFGTDLFGEVIKPKASGPVAERFTLPPFTILDARTGEWQEGGLVESDFAALVAMLDWLKSQGDEPLMFFYSTSRPAESLLARVDSDQVELRELMDYQPMAGVDRFFEARLGLSAVIAGIQARP